MTAKYTVAYRWLPAHTTYTAEADANIGRRIYTTGYLSFLQIGYFVAGRFVFAPLQILHVNHVRVPSYFLGRVVAFDGLPCWAQLGIRSGLTIDDFELVREP